MSRYEAVLKAALPVISSSATGAEIFSKRERGGTKAELLRLKLAAQLSPARLSRISNNGDVS